MRCMLPVLPACALALPLGDSPQCNRPAGRGAAKAHIAMGAAQGVGGPKGAHIAGACGGRAWHGAHVKRRLLLRICQPRQRSESRRAAVQWDARAVGVRLVVQRRQLRAAAGSHRL